MSKQTQNREIECPRCGWVQKVEVEILQDASTTVVVQGNVIKSLAKRWKSVTDPLAEANDLYDLPCPNCGKSFRYNVRSGEVRKESPAVLGGLIAGVQMDEDGYIYFATSRRKLVSGKAFLKGRGGTIGTEKPLRLGPSWMPANNNPGTGTLVKADPKKLKFLFVQLTKIAS